MNKGPKSLRKISFLYQCTTIIIVENIPFRKISNFNPIHIEIRKIKKQEDKEDKEGRKKSITPRSDSEEGAGASENLKWPKSTKNLVNYFKNLENSVQSGESI